MNRYLNGAARTGVAFFALCLLATSAAAADNAVLRLARSEDGAVVQVRPIDDPGNPYTGQYSDYDRWFWDNYAAEVTENEKKHFGG
jgi:hypothetical protein